MIDVGDSKSNEKSIASVSHFCILSLYYRNSIFINLLYEVKLLHNFMLQVQVTDAYCFVMLLKEISPSYLEAVTRFDIVPYRMYRSAYYWKRDLVIFVG